MNSLKSPIFYAAALCLAFPLAAQVTIPAYIPVKVDQTDEPVYPRSLVTVGVKSGAASIAVAIDDNGKMVDYVVTAYTHPEFAQSALAAMKKWRFEPARVHGSPRNSKADLTFRFEVEGVVVVSLTPLLYSELLRFKIAPDSMAYSACTLGQLDRIPTPKKIVNPIYPSELARSSRGGHVSVDFYIDETGHVRIPSVSKETNEANEELASVAVTTVAQWEFEPPMSKGKAVLVLAKQDFDFKPAGPDKKPESAPAKGGAGALDSPVWQHFTRSGAGDQSPFGAEAVPFLSSSGAVGPGITKGFTVVSAHSYSGYSRETLADGSFAPETYALGNGTRWDIAMADASMDNLSFEQIAQNIAGPLSDQNYLPAKDPSRTNLLIVVYWGTTSGSSQAPGFNMPLTMGSPASGQSARNGTYTMAIENLPIGGLAGVANDMRNARMLGFDFPNKSMSYKFDTMNLLDEIESNRYFVGLVAYDFQLLWKQNVRKVLWVTRYSILEHRNEFDRSLPEITKYASQFFGQDSHGFVVKRLKEGHVDVGPVSAVGSRDEQ